MARDGASPAPFFALVLDCPAWALQSSTVHCTTCLDCHTHPFRAAPSHTMTAVPITDAPNVTGPCLNKTIRSETAEPDKAIPGPTLTRPSFPGLPNQTTSFQSGPEQANPVQDCRTEHFHTEPNLNGPCLGLFYPGALRNQGHCGFLPRRCNHRHALPFQDCPTPPCLYTQRRARTIRDCPAGTCLIEHRPNVTNPSLPRLPYCADPCRSPDNPRQT